MLFGDSAMDGQTMSNIERSRIARAEQGAFETEVSLGGRQDLPTIKEECKKNPGHETFIPVENLSLDHFPQEYREDKEVLEYARLQAVLTICVVVNYTSLARPKTFPGSDVPYPFYKMRGSLGARFGTGSVELIHDYNQDNTDCKCKCKECIMSEDPKTDWGKIIIQTVKHVVFNDEEGQKTDIELFYDTEERDQVYMLTGTVQEENIDSDWCLIYCPTHDMELVKKLQDTQHRFHELKQHLFEKYRSMIPKPMLAVIVSHPHGCQKHVTVGTWTDREEFGPYHTRYVYTTATCPGSSGARVWILAEHEDCRCFCHMHSQTIDIHRNMSGIGWY